MRAPVGEFKRLSDTLTPRVDKRQQTARGILENTGKCTASRLVLMPIHCDVLITGRSPSDQSLHPICAEVSESGVDHPRFHAVGCAVLFE